MENSVALELVLIQTEVGSTGLGLWKGIKRPLCLSLRGRCAGWFGLVGMA